MRSRIINKLRAQIRNLGNGDALQTRGDRGTPTNLTTNVPEPSFSTPFHEFYGDLLNKNLTAFNSFALQSRSILARSVYARAATNGLHDMTSLQMEIDELLNRAKDDVTTLALVNYKLPILLALANYLLNTSQGDLDTHAGLQILRFVLRKYGDDALSEHDKLQFVEATASLGAYDEQDKLSQRFDLQSLAPVQADLLAIDRIAHQGGSTASWIAAMNDFYVAHDMQTIQLKDDVSLPLLDRLTSHSEEKIEGPLVSIIVPTFSPDKRIHTAVSSLLRQSWKNLEILIVDDGSPTTFNKIYSELEELDPRIRIIRQRTNAGAYTARNAGLATAQGTFVTTHDDDDWSHPDKIAHQASVLMNDATIMATTAGHIRTTSDMKFRRINARPQHLQTNYSSLMFRKEVTDRVGAWDTSKRGSDTELVDRIRAHYGKSAVVNLADKPLSFSRVWDGSLTSGEIYRGYFAYSRLLYRWSFRQWHREIKKQGMKPVLSEGNSRPFAIPTTFEPANRNKDLGIFDVIYVTDFNQRSKFTSTVLHEIKTAAQSELRVGYMHINSPHTIKGGDISPELFRMQLEGDVTQVAENDKAETKLMLVYDSSVGMFLDQFRSSVAVRRGVVVHDTGVTLKGARSKDAAYPSVVLRHLDQSFNTSFSIVGASREDHDDLKLHVPNGRLLDNHLTWSTHIAMSSRSIRKPGKQAVIGFHCFGNKYRWPSTREVFQQVYVSDDYPSLFYGNIAPVRKQLGEDIIGDDQIVDASQTSLVDFLEMIDFWVHHPHVSLSDRPWPPILEALQAGKVVILPPFLEATYGNAAVYADHEEIEPIVAKYSQDVAAYFEQAKRGQNYVEQYYSMDAYLSRLEKLGSESAVQPK